MYTIEIVPVDRGWILETIANAIQRESTKTPERYQVKIVNKPTDRADLTFFLPESAFQPLKSSISVTYLAHKEDDQGAAALFEDVARKSDYCITSSTKYEQILLADGAKKVFKIHLGVDTEKFVPKLILGVVGRTYHTGRKGESLLAEIAGMPMVELRFTGGGWPYPADYYSTEDLVEFYQQIDYLLVPSLIEGGPVPMLEALSSGCAVIAPSDIGLVGDFPHIPFQRGDSSDLRHVIECLLEEKTKLRTSVLRNDWSQFAKQHLEIFTKIIDSHHLINKGQELGPSLPDSNKVRVLLVTHGTEEVAKGGPSTRVRFISEQLRAQSHFVGVKHNIRSISDLVDFDIVHIFNSWPPQTAHQAIAIAKQAGKKVIFSPIVLDLWHWPIFRQLIEYVLSIGSSSAIESVVNQLPSLIQPKHYIGSNPDEPIEGISGHFEALRKCCLIADHVIFLSEYERGLLKAIGAKTDYGTLIHNGVSDSFLRNTDSSSFLKKYSLNQYILCVGRIEYRKNQALLAMAMRDVNVALVLIGDEGDLGYLNYVRSVAGENLFYIPRIDDPKLLASAYAGASAFVLPSWCEGAPLAALEAGLTGVPLILSNMSSESEYFGSNADYVNPADIREIRDVILRVLARNEGSQEREARKAILKSKFSEAEHVRQTLSLYRREISDTISKKDEAELILDVSSLLHSLRVNLHLTGVPLAESRIISEIIRLHPSARCIAFNSNKKRFIEIPYNELKEYDEDRFNRLYWFSEDTDGDKNADLRLEVNLPGLVPPPQLEPENQTALRRHLWISRLVRVTTRLGLSEALLRRFWRITTNIRYELISAFKKLVKRQQEVEKISDKVAFENILRYVTCKRVSQPRIQVIPGSRILSLGQSWLSNEPLLNCLIEFSSGHYLEAYVYDISYISGAHYSGWADNLERQRRLEKLLAHCRTVFTESRTTAAEIAKFGETRAFSYRVVTTKLRGKELALKLSYLSSRTPTILYVSSFNRRKNHDFIVNVWRDLMQSNSALKELGAKLVFVGEIQGEMKYGDAEFLKDLKNYNIEVIHNVDDEKLSSLYSQCLFTVYPSLQEGWGIPVQESLCHGKVCITSDTVPVAEEIDNAALIKLSPTDFFGWREAIETWATNNKMRAAFELEAKAYIPPTWHEITKTILHIST